jgi:hypothetical protein
VADAEPGEPAPTEPRDSGWDLYDDSEEWGRGDWEQEVEGPPRPWPTSSLGYLAVVAVGLVGLVLMAVVGWGQAAENLFRPGALLVAAAVCLAAALRAVLPDEAAGMLVLRSRRIDVAVYSALGVAALVLAILVPPPS